MKTLGKGLGELWSTIKEDLEEIVDCYEKVNKVTSLGTISKFRRKAVEKAHVKDKIVLDAGAGPGYIGKEALKQGSRFVILLDPIERMIQEHSKTIGTLFSARFSSVQGVFEAIPVVSQSVDAVITSFALRDAYDLELAVKEISRILRPDGVFVILDFHKPVNKLHAKIIELYLKYGFVILSVLAGCKKPSIYKDLYKTYRKHLTGEEYVMLLSKYFEKVKLETHMLGAVMILVAEKPIHTSRTQTA